MGLLQGELIIQNNSISFKVDYILSYTDKIVFLVERENFRENNNFSFVEKKW
jgi:hypothetical protein